MFVLGFRVQRGGGGGSAAPGRADAPAFLCTPSNPRAPACSVAGRSVQPVFTSPCLLGLPSPVHYAKEHQGGRLSPCCKLPACLTRPCLPALPSPLCSLLKEKRIKAGAHMKQLSQKMRQQRLQVGGLVCSACAAGRTRGGTGARVGLLEAVAAGSKQPPPVPPLPNILASPALSMPACIAL